MNNKELDEPVSNEDLKRAVEVYDRLLNTNNFKTPKDKIILSLLGRSECCAELNKYETVVSDSRRVIKMLAECTDTGTTLINVRRRLIFALYKTKKIGQALDLADEWLSNLYSLPDEKQPQKTISLLERYLGILRTVQTEKDIPKVKQSVLDAEVIQINSKLDTWVRTALPQDRLSKSHSIAAFNSHSSSSKLSNSSTSPTSSGSTSSSVGSQHTNSDGKAKSHSSSSSSVGSRKGDAMSSLSSKSSDSQQQLEKMKSLDLSGGDDNSTQCTYCGIGFIDRIELMAHCQTESHQIVIMSDEGKSNIGWMRKSCSLKYCAG